MSPVIRIEQVASTGAAVITRHRSDVPAIEPHSLISESRIEAGQAITLSLHAGEVVAITREEDRRHG